MGVPVSRIEEKPAGPALTVATPNVPALIGYSSTGPLNQPTLCATLDVLKSTFGVGPMVKAAARLIAKGINVVCVREPATARAASTSAVTYTGTGTLVPTVSGTPDDGYDWKVLFTVGGTIGVSGIFYKVSQNGGTTYGAATALGTNTTIALGAQTLNLTATQTVAANGYVSVYTLAASGSVLPVTVTRANSGTPSTSAITITGTPEDHYEVVFEVPVGGTVGTAGIETRYSLDAGNTWSPRAALGTGNAVPLLERHTDGTTVSTGLTVNLGAGTLDTGDKAAASTTEPEVGAADRAAGLTVLRSANLKWGFVYCPGPVSAVADASSVESTLVGWATGTKFTHAIMELRDRGTYEGLTVWSSRVLTSVTNYAAVRASVWAGRARVTDPLTGRRNRRGAGLQACERVCQTSAEEDIGRYLSGSLSGDVSIHDANNVLVEHDARIDPTLHDAGVGTLRTWEDEAGVYITYGAMKGPPNDIGLLAHRRVLNEVEASHQKAMQLYLVDGFRRWRASPAPPSPYVAGDVYEPDAKKIERLLRENLEQSFVRSGKVSSVSVVLVRTPVALGQGKFKLNSKVTVNALGYVHEFVGEVKIEDPALVALTA